MIIALYWYGFHLTLDKERSQQIIRTYIYIYIYIYMYHHHTVQVAQVQLWFLHQRLDEKAPPAQVAEGIPVLVADKNHHQHKLQLVTTITCASGMFAPVQRRKHHKHKVQRSGPASVLVSMGCSNNMQLQPPPPPLTRYDQHSTMQQSVQLVRWLIL